jgi:hypothetical protein
MRRRDTVCRAHAAGLTALAANREPVPHRTALVAHLDRCDRCTTDLQELTLTVVALRRIGALPDRASIGASAWPRVRARILRSRASAATLAWRWRTTLAGLAAGTLVVAGLVAPLAVHVPVGGTGGAEPVGYTPRELDMLSYRIEQSYLFDARSIPYSTSNVTWEPHGGFLMRYPDGIQPVGKEVDLRPAGHAPIVD